jgi:KDO2-lipid IV(A) lauroyltransferase
LGGLEIGTGMFCSIARLQRRSRVIGAEHLTQLESGALLLSLHNTTVDTAGSAFNPRYDKVDMMYRAHKNPVFELLQRRGRQRFNGQTKLIERKDVRGAIRTMRKGRWLWYAPDQDYGIKQGIFSQFFGVQAASVTATSRFARSAKVPVVPFVHYRDDNYHCVVEVFAPLENFPSDDEAADVQRVNDWIETTVRQRPEQYLWVHRRFKTRPAGEPSVYKR